MASFCHLSDVACIGCIYNLIAFLNFIILFMILVALWYFIIILGFIKVAAGGAPSCAGGRQPCSGHMARPWSWHALVLACASNREKTSI